MPQKCERPKCYRSKSDRCSVPNPWIIYNKETAGKGMSMQQKKAGYVNWKNNIITPDMSTPKIRQFALCTHIQGSPLTRGTSPEAKQRRTEERIKSKMMGALERARSNLQIRKVKGDFVENWKRFADESTRAIREEDNRMRENHKCELDEDTVSALRNVLKISVGDGEPDVCHTMSQAMPVGALGYRITSMLAHGYFGVVMNMIDRKNNSYVMKITRVVEDEYDGEVIDVKMKSGWHEWDTITQNEFNYGVRVHQMIHDLKNDRGEPLINTPKLVDVMTMKVGRDEAGLMIMSRISGVPLIKCMENKDFDIKRKRRMAGTAGAILRSLHNLKIVHGDSHLSNFMLGDDNKVYILDFDRSSSIEGVEERLAKRFRTYDLIQFILLAKPEVWDEFQVGYGEKIDTVVMTIATDPRSLEEMRGRYFKLYFRHLKPQIESMTRAPHSP
jgi:tRNA A-37 threonylcarbamoyl transferase component Bud32